MTTFTIDTNDKSVIEQVKKMLNDKLHLQVQILENISSAKIAKKSKWAEFADKIDGVFTPEIAEHIRTSSREFRDNFDFRTLETK